MYEFISSWYSFRRNCGSLKKEMKNMSKVAIVYYSATGNTEMMANAVADGVRNAGGSADVIDCTSFSASDISNYDAFAFGCPAMGAEQLEEGSFEPMFSSVETMLNGKKVGLFGSYGWGVGEWMELWAERVMGDGANLINQGVIANYAPDAEAVEACNKLGAELAS